MVASGVQQARRPGGLELIGMSAYPRMFALLDVQRTAKGRPALHMLDTHSPHPVLGGGSSSEEIRSRRLSDLAATLAADVAWLNRPVEGPDVQEDFRQTKFDFGRGHSEDSGPEIDDGLDILLAANFRPAVPPALAGRCMWAYTDFPGGNSKPYLTPENPAWAILRAFLTAVQPTSAFTTLDTDSPALPCEYEKFQNPWHPGSSSVFLGPELVRLIPDDLLDPNAGFSQIERLGKGVWFTIARAALYQPN